MKSRPLVQANPDARRTAPGTTVMQLRLAKAADPCSGSYVFERLPTGDEVDTVSDFAFPAMAPIA